MLRVTSVALGSLAALLVWIGSAHARDFVLAKLKAVDVDSLTITFTVEDEEHTFDVSKDVLVFPISNVGGAFPRVQTEVPEGLNALKPDDNIRVFTLKRGEKEVVVQIGLYTYNPEQGKGQRDRKKRTPPSR